MAQLRDLIVNGPSRFLGKAIYNHNVLFTKDVTFDCDILPGSSNRNVGSDASPWKRVYAETLSTEGLVTTGGDASTSTTTGDIQVAGGIGVAKTSFFADKIYNGTTTYYIDGDGTSVLYALTLKNALTVDDVTTLKKKLTVSSGGITVTAGGIGVTAGGIAITAGHLALASGNNITLAKGNITSTEGNLTLTKGNITLSAGNADISGKVTITNGDAYDGTKYDLKTTGGIWVVKNSYFADRIYTGTYNSDATKAYYIEGDSTSRLNNLQLAGTLSVAGATTLKATTTTTLSATDISCATLTSTGQITAGNKLVVTTGGATVSAGGLNVTGASTFNNGVSITSGDDYSYNGTTRSADLQVAGGVSVRKKLNVGTNLMIADKAVMSYDSSDECLYFSFA